MEKAKTANIPIILDIDYRPYTWTSSQEASKVYLKASVLCDILIGNDDEFGILAMNYNKGLELAKSLTKQNDILIYKMGEKGSLTITKNKVC